ncbi:MAG: hypothetical protein K0Q74_1689 [Gammaproteobacteria bacterium]|nr:hypothetical protein [Gammaproteobacteria bacterium]
MIQTVNAGQVNRDLNYFERQYQYHYYYPSYYPSPGNQPREKQILPLDFLQCLQARLREKYTQYDQLERLFDERKTPIVDSFINLALIKETEHKEKEKGLGFNTSQAGKDKKVFVDERMASHEELYAPKEPLALNQLFEPKDDTKAPNKVLILGRAGIGKSVLCQYLAVQWASESKDEEQKQGEIGNYFRQKFDAVF